MFRSIHAFFERATPKAHNTGEAAARAARLSSYLRELPRDDLGNWLYPDDPNQPAPWWDSHIELCRLKGWSPKVPRTRAEFDRAVLLCANRLDAEAQDQRVASVVEPIAIPQAEPDLATAPQPAVNFVRLKPALSADDAARRFVFWLRNTKHVGPYSDDELEALYSEHASSIGHYETASNRLRGAMRRIPGVLRQQPNGRSAATGKRARHVIWSIRPISMPDLRIAA